MRRWPNVGLPLAHRLRRWFSSEPTFGQIGAKIHNREINCFGIVTAWARVVLIVRLRYPAGGPS